MPPPQPTIRNIVCTVTIPISSIGEEGKRQLCLSSLANRMVNTEYRPSRFSALVLRIRRPVRAAALLFSTGKMVCLGTKSVADAHKATKRFLEKIILAAELPKSLLMESVETFSVKNVVGSTALKGRVNLQGNLQKIIQNPIIIICRTLSFFNDDASGRTTELVGILHL